MFTYSERDMHRMPAPIKTHLPIKTDILNSGIIEEDAAGRENEIDPNLSRLPAPALHGTFAKAYSLLTRLVSKIGWDNLLKCRSEVFVMEEEYRMQKAKEDSQKTSPSVNNDSEEKPESNDNNNETETATIDAEAEKKETKEEDEETLENELTENMETVDLNDEEDKENTPIEVPHTPLVRPEQVAEDKSKVRKDNKKEECVLINISLIMVTETMYPSKIFLIQMMVSVSRLAISVFVSVG